MNIESYNKPKQNKRLKFVRHKTISSVHVDLGIWYENNMKKKGPIFWNLVKNSETP